MNTKRKRSPYVLAATAVAVALIAVAGFMLLVRTERAATAALPAQPQAPQSDPTSVTLVGSLQSELGCPGDWQPECAAAYLTYVANDDVWQGSWALPAGEYEYKVALNDSWAENYGAGGARDGANIPLSIAAETTVNFYYDHKSHWIIDDLNALIVTAAGNMQSEFGCSGDWDPGCLRAWLQDLDGDGVYTLEATDLPAGNYEFKVTVGRSWDENYGADGVPGGANIPFTIADPSELLIITWDSATNIPTVGVRSTVVEPGPTSVTLVGNLQEGLGCPGNWQPACEATMLTKIGNGVWRGEFEIITANAPYTWEYKMALNGSWAENYPATNISLPLTDITTTVRFYYDHKTHAVLDSVNDDIAVAAGSFQSALGCPGDWQPDCVITLLTDVDGDGVYKFQTTAIPAGDYEYKVALDEGWATAYPGGNMALHLPEDDVNVIISWDSATTDVTHTLQTMSDLAQPTAQHPIQEEVFYFVMPDRFQNGDATNDQGGLAGDKYTHGFDPTDKAFYHGGDLQGLIDELEYIDNLGISAIWLTPMLKNRAVQGAGASASAGYHGYWTVDFSQSDPHFGSNADLQAFVTAAHARGIKVFFDIIVNHTADVIDFAEGSYNYRNKTDYPYLDADGNPFDDRDYVGRPAGEWPVLSATVSFPYTPIFLTPEDAAVKVPAWLNDPIYYHNRGNVGGSGWDDPEEGVYGDFYNLDDLFTEHPDVLNGMLDIFKTWVDFGVDGFRLDTVKHVNIEFWQAFAPAIVDHAANNGNPDFFMFGEVYSGDKALLSRYMHEGQLQAVLDFSFQGAANAYVAGGKAADLGAYFASDDYFIGADSNAYNLPTFLGNHDMGRFGYFLRANLPGAGLDTELLERSKLGHALMYFARGAPVVYYGDEQGFTGSGGDKDARQDMFSSQVAEYDNAANAQIGASGSTPAADNFDPMHPLYQALADFAALRGDHRALQYGAQIHRYGAENAGIYAFSRFDRDDRVEYVLAFNNANATQTASFATYGAELDFTAVYTYSDVTVPATLASDAQGYVTVTVPARGFVIYQADEALPAPGAAPGVSFTDLDNGDAVAAQNDRVEIAVTLNHANVPAEVTFVARVGTELEYQVGGVDNNAPFRIYYDVSGLPIGTPISFRAIATDMAGNYTMAQVDVVVGEYTPPPAAQEWAIIHYQRPAGDYGDWSSLDFNDFWGLHLWGNAIHPDEGVTWDQPKKFAGIDDFGAYVAIRLQDSNLPVNYIVHKGNDKDTPNDRSFNPAEMPHLWIVQGDPANYGSRAEAQGYVTIHYTRTDGIFTDWGLHLWQDGYGMTNWPDRHLPDGYDDFGAYFIISATLYPDLDFTEPLNFLFHNGAGNQSGDMNFLPTARPAVWVQSGDDTPYPHRGAIEDFAVIYYRRLAGDYGDYESADFNDFWGLHAWGAVPDPGWTTPYKPVDQDAYGVVFELPLTAHTNFGYILHRGNDKDPGPDQNLDLAVNGYEVWLGQGLASGTGVQNKYDHPAIPIALMQGVQTGDLTRQKAYWLSEDTLAWSLASNAALEFRLYYDADAGLTLGDTGVSGGDYITLTVDPAGLPAAIKAKFPHLASLPALRIGAADLALAPDILKSQFAIAAYDGANLMDATGLQIPGVLDDLYTYTGALGVTYSSPTPTLQLWAPTAQNVVFHLFEDALANTTSVTYTMDYDADDGVWSITGAPDWTGQYYLYEVVVFAPAAQAVVHNLVTDPYAVSLAMNSARSQIVNLRDPALAPAGWDTLAKPPLAAPEDIAIYELHIRDFSFNDPLVPEEYVGTFKAFTLEGTRGVQHLQALADTGLTHLHLLPVMDIATINEDKSTWQDADYDLLATYPPDSDQPQAALAPFRDLDGFNWGYDPLHYGVPEGSYATVPTGTTRIVEFREMVQALNEMGLRLVVDVVYNHTNASGQSAKSVLDRIVPGYYHRLNATGQVENSTCCANTATEHAMMEKLMIDTLIIWARDYKVDAFRFDLMGHHMKDNMLNVRAALDALTLEDNGVDGSAIYIYGEGWNFGEVANNARGVNATQANMAGTGIGTFNDRARDALRGGGPFDSGAALRSNQGFINGLYYDPNAWNSGSAAELARLRNAADLIRVGLAGNLADYAFIGAGGTLVTGKDVDYNGSPAGYTALPVENIIYVSKHDNQTLYDNNQYKLPDGATMDERVRAQNMGLSFVSLAQGVPFLHAGSDMLRSKSLDRDSYNSGDWFNRLDFTYQDNNWGVGLPPAAVGGQSDNWPLMAPLLANPDLKPTSTDILSNVHHLQEMLAIRQSTPLFRLQTLADVQARLAFHNTGPTQIPGLIVMRLSDADGSLGSPYSQVVVLFNANDEAQTFTEAVLVGANLVLHPVQAAGHDPVVKTASFTPATGAFAIPARTTAVFVVAVPVIDVTPLALDVTLDEGMTAAKILTVSNTGGANLIWQLLEDPEMGWLQVDWETAIGFPILTLPGESYTATASFDASGLLPGVYTTTLIITSNDPARPQITIPVTLTVPCLPVGIIALTSDSPVELGAALHFTATVTGSQPISYTWGFGGAGLQGGTDANPTFIYDEAGEYTVTLTVTNGCGTDMREIVVTVSAETPPTYYIFLPLVMRAYP